MSLNMHPVFQLNYNKLYLGNIRLQTSQMRAVLTVLDVNVKVEGSFHKWIPATDAPDFNLKKHFDEGADYIHEHLQRGNVLVHCYAGISRSASIVMAYLIKY
jgi:protein-tyrosine phosphatase